MDKLAPCSLLQHGAGSQSLKLSTPRRSTSLRHIPGPGRTLISVVRCASTHQAGTATSSIDIATGRHTKPHGGDGVVVNGASFDFERYLSAHAKAVDDALDAALTGLRCPARLAESMRYSVLGGGKRVRPVLAVAACELVGGPASAALPVACAAELVHAASLVHDDMPCMDDDALRRGRASCHAAFGEHAALLAGDALLALAFEHIARACIGVPADRALRAVAELAGAAGAGGVAAGQAADKDSEGDVVTTSLISLAELEYIHVHKTARLVEAAAVCGAVVGGAGDGEVGRVRRYARAVGLLFQVVDDVLDATRTTEQLGKTAGKDAAAGKATYPRLMGVDRARAYAAELRGGARRVRRRPSRAAAPPRALRRVQGQLTLIAAGTAHAGHEKATR